MYRTLVASGFAIVLCALTVMAKEYTEVPITHIDTDKHTVTAKVGDKDVTFSYTDKTSFGFGKKDIDPEKLSKFAEFVNAKGATATIVTAEEKDKEIVDKDGRHVASRVTFVFKKKDKED